jgi:hypothetical protein
MSGAEGSFRRGRSRRQHVAFQSIGSRGSPASTMVNLPVTSRGIAGVRTPVIYGTAPLRRQCTLYSGEGGGGKSTELEHLCAAFAIGQRWLDCTLDNGPAWYLEAEDEDKVIHRRLAPITTHYDVTFGEIAAGGFRTVSFAGKDSVLAAAARNGRIEPTALYKRLLEEAGDIKPKMIAIASLANVYAGSEIDRSQVQQFVGLMTRIAMVANGGLVLAAHPSLTGIRLSNLVPTVETVTFSNGDVWPRICHRSRVLILMGQ